VVVILRVRRTFLSGWERGEGKKEGGRKEEKRASMAALGLHIAFTERRRFGSKSWGLVAEKGRGRGGGGEENKQLYR